jgi:hypothetical protein
LWLAVIHAAAGLFALYRMTRRPAMPLADQGAYVAQSPRPTAVAAAMYAEEAAEEARAMDESQHAAAHDRA